MTQTDLTEVDHMRGLCGEPNVPNNTPQMQIRDGFSQSLSILGVYELICPVCP